MCTCLLPCANPQELLHHLLCSASLPKTVDCGIDAVTQLADAAQLFLACAQHWQSPASSTNVLAGQFDAGVFVACAQKRKVSTVYTYFRHRRSIIACHLYVHAQRTYAICTPDTALSRRYVPTHMSSQVETHWQADLPMSMYSYAHHIPETAKAIKNPASRNTCTLIIASFGYVYTRVGA